MNWHTVADALFPPAPKPAVKSKPLSPLRRPRAPAPSAKPKPRSPRASRGRTNAPLD